VDKEAKTSTAVGASRRMRMGLTVINAD
jgi:hypothetical protein